MRPSNTCGREDLIVQDAIAALNSMDTIGTASPSHSSAMVRFLDATACARARAERDEQRARHENVPEIPTDMVRERRERLTVLRITWIYFGMVVLALPAYASWCLAKTTTCAFAWGSLTGAIAGTLWDLRPTAEHVLSYGC